jgi:hypothetical protein
MTAGTELSCPVDVSEVSAGATLRAGTDAQEFIEEFLWVDSRIRIVAMNEPAMENLTFECRHASAQAACS